MTVCQKGIRLSDADDEQKTEKPNSDPFHDPGTDVFRLREKSAQEAEENIELLDPVSVAASYVPAEYRDMYEYKVVSAVCSPALSECVMETSMTFQAYEKTPGEPVEKGEVLISGYTGDLDQRIEDQTKAIADMEENHADELEQRADSLEKTEKNYWKEMELLEDLKKAQPDKDSEDYEAWMA